MSEINTPAGRSKQEHPSEALWQEEMDGLRNQEVSVMASASVKKLQQDIVCAGGLEVSTATLRTEDLLTAFLDLCRAYRLRPSTSLISLAALCRKKCQQGKPDWEHDLASFLVNEEIPDYLESIAPPGYYYGCLEGDGSCFGFWKCEEEE